MHSESTNSVFLFIVTASIFYAIAFNRRKKDESPDDDDGDFSHWHSLARARLSYDFTHAEDDLHLFDDVEPTPTASRRFSSYFSDCSDNVTFTRRGSLMSGYSTSVSMSCDDENNSQSSSREPARKSKRPSLRLKRSIRSTRRDYNRNIMPNRVILVRHGESEGNVNETEYASTPDNMIRITKDGWKDAIDAGKFLRENITNGESVYFIVSPYVRTMETFHGILHSYCDPSEFSHIKDANKRKAAWYAKLRKMGLRWHEDPRIREQDFGNYQNPQNMKKWKKERHKFGPFYYRFPDGESGSDVFDRVSTFLDSLWRNFESQSYQNYVLVTHGIAIRILLARYFRYTIEQFNAMANPSNCELVVLEHDGKGKLELHGKYNLEDAEIAEEGECVRQYRFSKKLVRIPEKYRVKRNIRMTSDDYL